MSTIDPRTIATELIRSAAGDIDTLAISEHLESHDVDDPDGGITEQVDELLRAATVLVGWSATEPTSEPAGGADLDAIEARANAATPGPWEPDGSDLYAGGELIAEGGSETPPADAVFAAAARTDVPALATEVRRLRAALGEVRALCKCSDDFCPSAIARRTLGDA